MAPAPPGLTWRPTTQPLELLGWASPSPFHSMVSICQTLCNGESRSCRALFLLPGSSISVSCHMLRESFEMPALNRTASYKAQFEIDGKPAPATKFSLPADKNGLADEVVVMHQCWESGPLEHGPHTLHIRNLLSCDATPLIIHSFNIGCPAGTGEYGYLTCVSRCPLSCSGPRSTIGADSLCLSPGR